MVGFICVTVWWLGSDLVSVLSGDDDVEDIREGFPDLLESFSDTYDYSSDSDFEVDDEEAESHKMEELQAVAVAIRPEQDTPVPDDEKRGDTPQIEKEDTRSETSGVISVSDVESTFAELDDVKCVHAPEGPLLPTPTNLTSSHSTTDLKHLAKTVVISDVAFIT